MSNHDDAAFVRNFSLLLGGLCVIGLGAFILAKIVSDMHAIDHDAVAAKSRTAPVGAINSGSEPITVTTPLSAAAGPGASSAAAPVASGDLGKSTYDQLCFACHAQGIAGAPKYGDAAAWEARIATGRETLVKHAIEGYTGTAGVMPVPPDSSVMLRSP